MSRRNAKLPPSRLSSKLYRPSTRTRARTRRSLPSRRRSWLCTASNLQACSTRPASSLCSSSRGTCTSTSGPCRQRHALVGLGTPSHVLEAMHAVPHLTASSLRRTG